MSYTALYIHSLKELANSPASQCKLQILLRSLTAKSYVSDLLQQAKALSEVILCWWCTQLHILLMYYASLLSGCILVSHWLCLFPLQVNEDTQLVVLSKEEGSGLGFSIAGGVDLEQKAVTVSTACGCSGTYSKDSELSADVWRVFLRVYGL